MHTGISLFSINSKIVDVNVDRVIARGITAKEFSAEFDKCICWRPLLREEEELRDRVVAKLEEHEKKMSGDCKD